MCPSVKEGHQVTALFQLPSLTNEYRSKADEYLSHLVGHEGKGSLLSALKAKGWASELSAGVGESGYDRNTAAYVFEVHMNLTRAGLDAAPGTFWSSPIHACMHSVMRSFTYPFMQAFTNSNVLVAQSGPKHFQLADTLEFMSSW